MVIYFSIPLLQESGLKKTKQNRQRNLVQAAERARRPFSRHKNTPAVTVPLSGSQPGFKSRNNLPGGLACGGLALGLRLCLAVCHRAQQSRHAKQRSGGQRKGEQIEQFAQQLCVLADHGGRYLP